MVPLRLDQGEVSTPLTDSAEVLAQACVRADLTAPANSYLDIGTQEVHAGDDLPGDFNEGSSGVHKRQPLPRRHALIQRRQFRNRSCKLWRILCWRIIKISHATV